MLGSIICSPSYWVLGTLAFLALSMEVATHKGKPHPRYKNMEMRSKRREVSNVYKGCGYIKFCLKLCPPEQEDCVHCILNHNCPALVTVRYVNGKFKSEMLITHLDASDEYISLGLSRTGKMSEAPFIACIQNHHWKGQDLGRQSMFGGYTRQDYTVEYFKMDRPSDHPFLNKRLQIYSEHSNDTEAEQSDRPALVCDFQWRPKFSVTYPGLTGKVEYNLDTTEYYLIAAIGSAGDTMKGRWVLKGHNRIGYGRVATNFAMDLKKVKVVEGGEDDDYDEEYDGEDDEKMAGTASDLKPSLTIFAIISSTMTIACKLK